LSETYWELQSDDDPVGLEAFLDGAVSGTYGSATKVELQAFLAEVEEQLVYRIEQGEGGAHDAAAREELVDETRSWIDDLRSKYCED
jgi:hypothetical protein